MLLLFVFEQALEQRYHVEFCEPDTPWKFDPYELGKYDFFYFAQL